MSVCNAQSSHGLPFAYHWLVHRTSTLLKNGLAVSTRRNYDKWWCTFIVFCARFGLPCTLPVPERILCFFVAYHGECNSYSSLRVAVAAIRSRHVDVGLRCVTSEMLTLKRVMEGLARSRPARSKLIRLPITTQLLNRMRSVLDRDNEDHHVFFAICCLGTYGLLRSGEIFEDQNQGQPGLRVGDVTIKSKDEFSIHLSKSKTDQRKGGVEVEYFANSSPSCPVAAFVRGYWMRLGMGQPRSDPLFVWRSGRRVTKYAFIEMLRETIAALGLDPKKYSGHSFRRGGATSLAAVGVPASTIQHLGRWKSVTYQLYIDVTSLTKRNVSRAMSLASDDSCRVVFGGSLVPRPW